MPDERPDLFWHETGASFCQDLIDSVTSKLRRLSEGFAESAVAEGIVRDHHVVQAAKLLFKPDLLPQEIQSQLAAADAFNVFLSYSSQDEAWAREFQGDLEDGGLSTFLASRSINAGADWDERIWEAIRSCNIFVALLTTTALESDWCQLEAGAARGLRKEVVPVLRHIAAAGLPDALKQFQARQVQSREQQRQLVGELKALIERRG